MNPPPLLDDVAAAQPNPRPHQPETSPFPRLAASQPPPKDPPSSRIASGLFKDPEEPAQVEILLRTGTTRGTDAWEAAFVDGKVVQYGPTALIKMDPGTLTIQLHGPVDAIPRIPDSIRERVDWAIAWFSWFARTTVVVPIQDERPGAFLDWILPIHLLSEVTKTNVVDTYQHVKQIHLSCRKHAFDIPPLDLVIVNTPKALATLGARSLDQTTRTFLGGELPTACIIERMPKLEPFVHIDFDLQPGFGCDRVLELLDCRQRDRRHGRLGHPFP